MFLFTYWDNSKNWHGKQLVEITAESIKAADDHFTKVFGYHPKNIPTVGVTLVKV